MSVMLANGGSKDRKFSDFYPTPPEATQALINFLALPKELTVWEPAAGQGHMADVFAANGYKVERSDLHTYDKQDFLEATATKGDWIITNPPFSLSEQFIEKCATLSIQGFAMLLKSQYWHAARRFKLFNNIRPQYVLPLTWRPDFLFGEKKGAPTMEVLWTVWFSPYQNVGTIYEPLAKP